MIHKLVPLLILASIAMAAVAAPARPDPERMGVIGSPAGTGPTPAVSEVMPNLRGFVVYHPVRMPAAPMPIVVWGNGACADNGLSNSHFLREIASHGYLVVAVGHPRDERPISADPAPAPPPPAPSAPGGALRPPPGQDQTSLYQLFQAMDWAQAENDRSGSPFRGHVATGRIAVMGHSCGGLQAIAASADPRVTTTMIWNSGIYVRDPSSGRSGILLQKSALERLHAPISYITGGLGDIAHANAVDDVRRIGQVPVFFAHQPVGHGGTFLRAPNGGAYGKVAVAWLDWRLKGRDDAAALFRGDACGLCRDPAWTVERPVAG